MLNLLYIHVSRHFAVQNLGSYSLGGRRQAASSVIFAIQPRPAAAGNRLRTPADDTLLPAAGLQSQLPRHWQHTAVAAAAAAAAAAADSTDPTDLPLPPPPLVHRQDTHCTLHQHGIIGMSVSSYSLRCHHAGLGREAAAAL
jgi:hypothetical protein